MIVSFYKFIDLKILSIKAKIVSDDVAKVPVWYSTKPISLPHTSISANSFSVKSLLELDLINWSLITNQEKRHIKKYHETIFTNINSRLNEREKKEFIKLFIDKL